VAGNRLGQARAGDPATRQRDRLELELAKAATSSTAMTEAFSEQLLTIDELRATMPHLHASQQGSGVFRECPNLSLVEAVEAEGLGRGGMVAAAFGDVQVAGVLEGRDDGGADRGQVGRPASGPAGGGVFTETQVTDLLRGSRGRPAI
jgi:hypothetical protein